MLKSGDPAAISALLREAGRISAVPLDMLLSQVEERTLAEERQQMRTGIDPEKEARVLAAWHTRNG